MLLPLLWLCRQRYHVLNSGSWSKAEHAAIDRFRRNADIHARRRSTIERRSLRSSRTCARTIPCAAGACVVRLNQRAKRRMSWSRSAGEWLLDWLRLLSVVSNFAQTERTFSVAFAIAGRIAAKVLHQTPDGGAQINANAPSVVNLIGVGLLNWKLRNLFAALRCVAACSKVVRVHKRIARMRAR